MGQCEASIPGLAHQSKLPIRLLCLPLLAIDELDLVLSVLICGKKFPDQRLSAFISGKK